MESDKRVEVLENEIKLLKNEVKQTLINIREFLMSIKLPLPADEVDQEEKQSEFEELALPIPTEQMPKGAPSDLVGRPSPASENAAGDGMAPPEQTEVPQVGSADFEEQTPLEEQESAVPPSNEVPPPPDAIPATEDDIELQDDSLSSPEISELEEQQADIEQPEEETMKEEEISQSVSQVNLLANLMRWVSEAKKEIGSEQLSAFLDVYSVTGSLSAESREVIQHIASIIAQQTADSNAVDIWTRLTLELHGILSGGGEPLRLPDLSKKEDEDETKTNGNGANIHKLIKLKLVLPGDDGEEKEFGIALSPEIDGNNNGK